MNDMKTNTNSEQTNSQTDNDTDISNVDTIFSNVLNNYEGKSSYEKNSSQKQQQNTYDLSTESYIKKANAEVLLKTLAPQIEKNEKKKRLHKDKLITYLARFLGIQFAFVFLLIMTVVLSIIYFHATNNPFNQGVINILFAFFGTYLTSVIVELIYILKYIIEQVFDTSISSLTRVFSGKNDKDQES